MLQSERSRGGGQAETDDFDGLGLKTISGGWFPGFGRKIKGRLGAVKVHGLHILPSRSLRQGEAKS